MPHDVETPHASEAHGASKGVQLGRLEHTEGSPSHLISQAAALTARAELLRRQAASLDVRAIACRLASAAQASREWRAAA